MLSNSETDASNIIYDDILCDSEMQDLAECIRITSNTPLCPCLLMKRSCIWTSNLILRFQSGFLTISLLINAIRRRMCSWHYHPWAQQAENYRFLSYRGIHHVAALQRENNGTGICIWDAVTSKVIRSRIIRALSTADAVGMTEIDRFVGHHEAHGYCLGCPMKGRHKPNAGHYFAVHLQPNNHSINDCNHFDINIHELNTLSPIDYQQDLFKVVSSTDQTNYKKNCKETGISKPTILSRLANHLMFPIPLCFPLDLIPPFY